MTMTWHNKASSLTTPHLYTYSHYWITSHHVMTMIWQTWSMLLHYTFSHYCVTSLLFVTCKSLYRRLSSKCSNKKLTEYWTKYLEATQLLPHHLNWLQHFPLWVLPNRKWHQGLGSFWIHDITVANCRTILSIEKGLFPLNHIISAVTWI